MSGAHTEHPSSGDAPRRPAGGPRSRSAGQWLALLYGLLGAPFAWILQICACEALAAQGCHALTTMHAQPAVPHLIAMVGAISAACLVIGFGGFMVAWRTLRSYRRAATHHPDTQKEHAISEDEPARFLALVGAIASAIFVLGIIATALAAMLVSPCKPW